MATNIIKRMATEEELVSSVSSINNTLATMNDKLDYFTIINHQQLTSAYNTRSTYNGLKFSDYKLLLFTPYENDWCRASCIVPTWLFEQSTGVDIRYYQSSRLIEVDIKYVSDTTYDAKYIGSPPEDVFIYCFGLLKN